MAGGAHIYSIVAFTAVVLCGLTVADIPQQNEDQDDVTITLDKSWFNKTCKNIFCCIDGVLSGLDATDICLAVEGYGCHLRYQLQKFSDTQCSMEGTNKDTLMCHRNITGCVDDMGSVLLHTQDKVCSDAEEVLKPTLHCYRGGEGLGGLTCEVKNDTTDVSVCPDVAKCKYKKERVSCLPDWAPHRGHCYTYKEGPSKWQEAEDDCQTYGDGAHLTSIKRNEENVFLSTDLQKASQSDTDFEIWWTGLRRTHSRVFQWSDNNSTFNLETDYDNWGIESPETDVNHCAYVRNGSWFLANCDDQFGYTCKMPAYKSLYCEREVSTTMAPTYTTQSKAKQREESAKQVSEELKNVTRNLDISEETIDEINSNLDTVTNNVVGESEEASEKAVEAVDNIMDLLVNSIKPETLQNTSKPILIESEAMVVQVYAVKSACTDSSDSCSGPAIGGKVQDNTFAVDLPEFLVGDGATLAVSTVAGLEESMPTTVISDDTENSVETTIGSLITSIAISRWDNKPIVFSEEDPLVLTFSVLGPLQESSQRACSYWKPNEAGWSTDGCLYNEKKSNATHTTCECTHLTSFAVLMQVMEVEQKPLPRSLDYLTYIGCGLSIFCLMLLILIFLIQKMHRSDRNIIHMNLALALLIAQVIFVIGIDQTANQDLCKGIAACLHYFLLATFFWMLIEAIFLLSKTTSTRKKWLKLPFFLGVGWGSPVLIVGITLASAFDTAYHTENYCWLQTPKAIWAFVGPAILIILVNTGMLIKVIHVFLSLKANMNKKKKERIWLSLRAMLLTLPLLGFTWMIGIFSMGHKGTMVFAYIFVILNSLQGVFIFVLYCVMNDEVKKGLEKRMSIFSTRSSMASTPGNSSRSGRELGQSSKGSSKGSRQTP